MARIVWTEPALGDLDEIADYISLDKPEAARRLVRRVFERVDRLERYPNSGSVPPELKETGYRHLVVPPLRIFYRYQRGVIYIVYAIRGERQFRRRILEERAA